MERSNIEQGIDLPQLNTQDIDLVKAHSTSEEVIAEEKGIVNENFEQYTEDVINQDTEDCNCSICKLPIPNKEDEVDGIIDDFTDRIKCIFKAPDENLKDEHKVEKDFRLIFKELYVKYKCEVDDIPSGNRMKNLRNSIASKFDGCIRKSPSPDEVTIVDGLPEEAAVDGRIDQIEIKYLIEWAQDLEGEDCQKVEVVCDQSSLVRILEVSGANVLTEDGFIDIILQFHEDSTEKEMVPYQKVLKTMAYADMVKFWPPRLFILLIGLWSLLVLSWEQIGASLGYRFMTPDFCSPLILHPFRPREPWRYLTYAWLHSGWSHLGSNVLGLMIFGIPLEFSHHVWQICLVYHLGILAGSLLHYIFTPKMFLLGASAGVYALIMAHFSTILLNWREDEAIMVRRCSRFTHRRYIKSKEVRALRLVFVAMFVVFDIVRSNMIVSDCLGESCDSKIGHVSHIAGASAGLLAAIICFKNRRKETWEAFFRKFTVAAILILYTAAILFNFFGASWLPDYFPKQEELTMTQWENCCSFHFIDKCRYPNGSRYGELEYCFRGAANGTLIPDAKDIQCCRSTNNRTFQWNFQTPFCP